MNLAATTTHKLTPRSAVCVFLGYPKEQKGYHCLDLATNQIIISHHVLFYESSFPFTMISDPPSSSFDFVMELDCTPPSIGANTPTCTFGTAAPVDPTPQVVASGTHGSSSTHAPPLALAPLSS
jgi:hypothetical protein